jgi:hypothetical protein|tara:strand:+ start:432 stop:803 length:372 start_codon:yes stop_codon:yes gene_type:complete
MSKLLPTRLPVSVESEVSSDTYNRLVRVLEINLAEVDPENTRNVNQAQRNTLNFNVGTVIWNTTIGALQVFKGLYWENISTPTTPQGYEALSSLGSVTVTLDGVVSIELGTATSGYGVETYYT